MKALKTIVATAVIVFALTTVAMAGVQHLSRGSDGAAAAGQATPAAAQPAAQGGVTLSTHQFAALLRAATGGGSQGGSKAGAHGTAQGRAHAKHQSQSHAASGAGDGSSAGVTHHTSVQHVETHHAAAHTTTHDGGTHDGGTHDGGTHDGGTHDGGDGCD
jgi:hypothetical protein